MAKLEKKRLPRDFEKTAQSDEIVMQHLSSVIDPETLELCMLEDMKSGKLPPIEDWYWDSYSRTPCFIRDNDVYAFDFGNMGEVERVCTLDEYIEMCDARIRLRDYGKARIRYLAEHDYGTWFGMSCRGELWEHCQQIDDEAEDMEERMMLQRMAPYESLKDTDPIEYNRIWNNERAQVCEYIYRELIYK